MMNPVATSRPKRFKIVAAILACTAAISLLVAYVLPDCVLAVYYEGRRLISAALPLKKLPSGRPSSTDVAPCRGVVETTRSIAPDSYFPPGVLDCDGFTSGWYSKCLRALGEPSLWALSRSDPRAEVYRFLWLRSFHRPVSIRLVLNSDRTASLTSKITSEAGGLEPGTLIHNETIPVGPHQVWLFSAQFLQSHFWDLPARERPGGADGAGWILEAVADGRYHIVDRWSPPESDPVHMLGMTLMVDIAGMHLAPREVY
jgi:hypothetical protein